MEAAGFYETPQVFYESALCHIAEYDNFLLEEGCKVTSVTSSSHGRRQFTCAK
jgi:hypothetical protein